MPEAAPSFTVPVSVSLVSPTISFMLVLFSVSEVGAYITFTRQTASLPLWEVTTTSTLPTAFVVIAPVFSSTVAMASFRDL